MNNDITYNIRKSLFRRRLMRAKAVYISILISHIMASQIFPFSQTGIEKVRTVMGLLLMLTGIIIILIEFIKTNKAFLLVNDNILILYLCYSVFICIMNYKYGIVDNIKSLVWTTIHFLVVYTFASECPFNLQKSILKKIFILPILFWNITGVYSFYQFLFQISNNINGTAQGWYYNRLFGIYKDPNFSSVTSLCVIFMCLYIYKNNKKYLNRIVCIISIIIQTVYILLAHSRGGWISGIIGLYIYLWTINNKRYSKLLKLITVAFHEILIILMLAVLNVSLAFLPPLFKNTVINRRIAYQTQVSTSEIAKTNVNMTRTDLENKDISNGRFERWRLVLSIYRDKPLTGVSPQNLDNFVKHNYPEIYRNKNFGDFHNGYLAVLIGTGAIGAFMIIIFIIKMVNKFFDTFIMTNKASHIDAPFLGIIVVVAISAMIIQEIFWINSVGTILFWLSLGKLNSLYKINKGMTYK